MRSLGCDVGSLFTKVVLLDEDRLLAHRMVRTTGRVDEDVEGLVAAVLTEAGLRRADVAYLGATGSGAGRVRGADFVEDEVTCVAAATTFYLPEVELALQMGGQSIAAVVLDPAAGGGVVTFHRNDKCAAGTGRFLEMMSQRLGEPLDALDRLAAASTDLRPVSSQCVVFAESEAISLINAGVPVPDLLAGICDAIGRIVAAQGRRAPDAGRFTLTGGVARFDAVVRVVCERLDRRYHAFPEDPLLAAALGAALLEEAEEAPPLPPPSTRGETP